MCLRQSVGKSRKPSIRRYRPSPRGPISQLRIVHLPVVSTRQKHPARLKSSMLKAAVEDNVDTLLGRLPKRLGNRRRQAHRGVTAILIGALAFGVFLATARIIRGPTSRPTAARVALEAGGAPLSSSPALPSAPFVAQPMSPEVLALEVRRVVIDAGHGGENLGTSGDGGLLEKDLSLDIAQRVRDLTAARGLEPLMTRTSDETLSLRQRADIANAQRGDIFVSIHLNSIRPSNKWGVETYYLGPTNDRERNAVAAIENQQPGYELADMQLLLQKIYTDARRDESRRLAEAVQQSLITALQSVDPTITDRGVKMAPFVVLSGTGMPAILAEVSCLSNVGEAQRLRTIQYRQTIAEALVSGIETFARQGSAVPNQKG